MSCSRRHFFSTHEFKTHFPAFIAMTSWTFRGHVNNNELVALDLQQCTACRGNGISCCLLLLLGVPEVMQVEIDFNRDL